MKNISRKWKKRRNNNGDDSDDGDDSSGVLFRTLPIQVPFPVLMWLHRRDFQFAYWCFLPPRRRHLTVVSPLRRFFPASPYAGPPNYSGVCGKDSNGSKDTISDPGEGWWRMVVMVVVVVVVVVVVMVVILAV